MNKKLKLLAYVFNYYPAKNSDVGLDGYSMMKYLLKDDGVLGGIEEAISTQIDCQEEYVSINGLLIDPMGISIPNGEITLGTTSLSEDDLIKIKKVANI
jgi:hypothetical protein